MTFWIRVICADCFGSTVTGATVTTAAGAVALAFGGFVEVTVAVTPVTGATVPTAAGAVALAFGGFVEGTVAVTRPFSTRTTLAWGATGFTDIEVLLTVIGKKTIGTLTQTVQIYRLEQIESPSVEFR
jgi:hypothetical protein